VPEAEVAGSLAHAKATQQWHYFRFGRWWSAQHDHLCPGRDLALQCRHRGAQQQEVEDVVRKLDTTLNT